MEPQYRPQYIIILIPRTSKRHLKFWDPPPPLPIEGVEQVLFRGKLRLYIILQLLLHKHTGFVMCLHLWGWPPAQYQQLLFVSWKHVCGPMLFHSSASGEPVYTVAVSDHLICDIVTEYTDLIPLFVMLKSLLAVSGIQELLSVGTS